MKNRLLLSLFLTAIAITASATKIYVCGTKITGSTTFSTSGGMVSYNNNTRVLIINNVSYTKGGSSNNGVSVDDVDGPLTIKFMGTNSMTISGADVMLCKSKKATTIDITGTTTFSCSSSGHAALKLQDGDVTLTGSGTLDIKHTNNGHAIKGGAGTENLIFAIAKCNVTSVQEDLYNLKKVTVNPSSYTGASELPGYQCSTQIALNGHSGSNYAHSSNVSSWGTGTGVSIKVPEGISFTSLSNTTYATNKVRITDERNDPSYTVIGDFLYTTSGSYARLEAPTISYRTSGPESIAIPGYVTLGGVIRQVKVGADAFADMNSVSTVTCNFGVTEIEARAFSDMPNLITVNLPSSLTSIGDYAFSGSSWAGAGLSFCWAKLNPGSGTTISNYAFSGTNAKGLLILPTLDAITQAKSVSTLTSNLNINQSASPRSCCDFVASNVYYVATTMATGSTRGKVAIVGCENTSLTAPATLSPSAGSRTDYYDVTSVAPRAFENNTTIKSVTLNNNIESIGDRAFYDSYVSSVNTSAATIGDFAFYRDVSLSSLTLAEGVKTIGKMAFYGAAGLDRLTVPSTVTSVGLDAFGSWSSLRWVTWNAKSCADFTSSTAPFSDMNAVTSVSFGGVTRIPAYLCYNLSKINSLTVPSTVTSVGDKAFSGMTGLKSVGWYAANCSDFTVTTAPFYNLSGITSFNIGSTVTRVPAFLCYYLKGITSLTIPTAVTSIGNYAFSDCSNVKTITWNAIACDDFSDDYRPFSGLTNVTAFYFGVNVTKIPAYLCAGLSGVTSITIPSSVTTINAYAFMSTGLTSITIPLNVTTMGDRPFFSCSNLRTVLWEARACNAFGEKTAPFLNLGINKFSFGNYVNKIPAYLCYNLSQVKSVSLPSNLTAIGQSAFSGSGLSQITVPSQVTSIGNQAFYNCTNLDTVNWEATACADPDSGSSWNPFYRSAVNTFNISDNVTRIPAYLCYYLTTLTKLNIGSGIKSIGVQHMHKAEHHRH